MKDQEYTREVFPTEGEIDEAAQKGSRKLCGLTLSDWGWFIGALLLLYVFLGLLFWGLMEAAVEIRGNEYNELPKRFFGNFDRTERVLTNSDGLDVLQAPGNPTEGDASTKVVNYPEGCSMGSGDLLKCGETKGAELWSIFPWVAVVDANPGCAGQKFTTISNSNEKVLFASDGEFLPGVCVNGKLVTAAPNGTE